MRKTNFELKEFFQKFENRFFICYKDSCIITYPAPLFTKIFFVLLHHLGSKKYFLPEKAIFKNVSNLNKNKKAVTFFTRHGNYKMPFFLISDISSQKDNILGTLKRLIEICFSKCEKADFDQYLECAAPKSGSKYTTDVVEFSVLFQDVSEMHIGIKKIFLLTLFIWSGCWDVETLK